MRQATQLLSLAFLIPSAAATCFSASGHYNAAGDGDFLLKVLVWEGPENLEENAACSLVLPMDNTVGGEYWLDCKGGPYAALLFKKAEQGPNAISVGKMYDPADPTILDLEWKIQGIIFGPSIARNSSC